MGLGCGMWDWDVGYRIGGVGLGFALGWGLWGVGLGVGLRWRVGDLGFALGWGLWGLDGGYWAGMLGWD